MNNKRFREVFLCDSDGLSEDWSIFHEWWMDHKLFNEAV
jgi:hypothetical protein